MHYPRYAELFGLTVRAWKTTTTACGKRASVSTLTDDIPRVTCLACARTKLAETNGHIETMTAYLSYPETVPGGHTRATAVRDKLTALRAQWERNLSTYNGRS